MRHAILLVDDDPEILELFRHMLRREPFEVHAVLTALDAFDVLASHRITVVIADERMPGMPGTEFLARVQDDYPEAVRMMVTGNASVDVAMRAINEGQVFRFLTKPVRASNLISSVRDAVAAWNLQHDHGDPAAGARRQRAAIERLESEWQGLTHVERDATGAIVVRESADDLDALLREVQGSPGDSHGPRRH